MSFRKTLVTVIVFILIFSLAFPLEAFAELTDFSSMTEEELHELINGARNELTLRELVFDKDTVLIDQDGVKVYLTGNYKVNEFYYPDDLVSVTFEAVIINETDTTISVNFDSATVNGWDVSYNGIGDITAGHKKKDNLELYISEADITTYEEIEEVIFDLYVYDSDNWDTLFSPDPITVQFN